GDRGVPATRTAGRAGGGGPLQIPGARPGEERPVATPEVRATGTSRRTLRPPPRHPGGGGQPGRRAVPRHRLRPTDHRCRARGSPAATHGPPPPASPRGGAAVAPTPATPSAVPPHRRRLDDHPTHPGSGIRAGVRPAPSPAGPGEAVALPAEEPAAPPTGRHLPTGALRLPRRPDPPDRAQAHDAGRARPAA